MMSRRGDVPNLIISGKKSPTHFASNFPSTDQKTVDLKGEELNVSFQTEDELRICNTETLRGGLFWTVTHVKLL